MKPDVTVTRTALAAVIATAGLVTAVALDTAPFTATLLALASVGAVLALIESVRRRNPRAAVRGGAAVVATVLIVGVPAVGLLGLTSAERAATAVEAPSSDDSEPDGPVDPTVDPTAELTSALARADQIAPGGSSSLLGVDISDTTTTVRVLDPKTGREVSSSRYDGTWGEPSTSSTSTRKTFTAQQIKSMDLTAAVPAVDAARKRLGLEDPRDSHTYRISVRQRSPDGLLVAEFGGGDQTIEVDTSGAVADTLDAVSLEKFRDLAMRVMRENKLDPTATNVQQIDFVAMPDAASSIGSSIKGFALDFAKGPISSITVEPGRFPRVSETAAGNSGGFAISKLTPSDFLRIRDDLMKRHSVPAYDRDAVAMVIGAATDDRDLSPRPVSVIMRVGPTASEAEGVYHTDGEFRRDGVR